MFRTFLSRSVGVLACAAVSAAAVSGMSLQTLTWQDLIPSSVAKLEERADRLQKTFYNLEPEERKVFEAVGHELAVRERLANGYSTEGDLSVSELAVLEASPSAENPEATAFWKKVEKLKAEMKATEDQVEPAMNGRLVRIPGYVLPLELTGTRVQEFLLVPYVGACIHTPPPPANQMVHVRAPDGFRSEGLYAPVWVEGTLFTGGDQYKVSYIDGNASVEASYKIDATKVEKYE